MRRNLHSHALQSRLKKMPPFTGSCLTDKTRFSSARCPRGTSTASTPHPAGLLHQGVLVAYLYIPLAQKSISETISTNIVNLLTIYARYYTVTTKSITRRVLKSKVSRSFNLVYGPVTTKSITRRVLKSEHPRHETGHVPLG